MTAPRSLVLGRRRIVGPTPARHPLAGWNRGPVAGGYSGERGVIFNYAPARVALVQARIIGRR